MIYLFLINSVLLLASYFSLSIMFYSVCVMNVCWARTAKVELFSPTQLKSCVLLLMLRLALCDLYCGLLFLLLQHRAYNLLFWVVVFKGITSCGVICVKCDL